MSVPFKNRLQRYHKESLDTLFRTLQFKRGVERYSSGSTPLTTTVTVTAADFLGTAPGDTVKVLIPPVGAGKYLRLNTLVGKFKNATVAYDTMPVLTVATELSSISNLISLVSLGTTEEIVSIAGNNVATGINGSIYLQYKISGSTPTVGDGDVIFEIEYEILDF